MLLGCLLALNNDCDHEECKTTEDDEADYPGDVGAVTKDAGVVHLAVGAHADVDASLVVVQGETEVVEEGLSEDHVAASCRTDVGGAATSRRVVEDVGSCCKDEAAVVELEAKTWHVFFEVSLVHANLRGHASSSAAVPAVSCVQLNGCLELIVIGGGQHQIVHTVVEDAEDFDIIGRATSV